METDTDKEEVETKEEQEERLSREEAFAEYDEHRKSQYQLECPHYELDHGICLDCGKDCFDDVIAAAEFHRDCLEDR